MTKRYIAGVAALSAMLGLAAGSGLVSAHHSTTVYDHAKSLTITGRVVELHWVNPHVSLLIKGAVDDSSQQQEWVIEMPSPYSLVHTCGFNRNFLAIGDAVTVEFNPSRDNSVRGGALKKITASATGRVFTLNIRSPYS